MTLVVRQTGPETYECVEDGTVEPAVASDLRNKMAAAPPRLDIVTRHLVTPRRTALLARLQASLPPPSPDWVQTLLLDPAGRGIRGSHQRFRTYEPCAERIWVIDDDDLCEAPDLLSRLDPDADLQVFRVRYLQMGLLPNKVTWAARLIQMGQIGPPCCVVHRDLWLATRHAWGDRYEGDYDFYAEAAARAQRMVWTDHIIAKVDHVSGGRA